MKLSRFIFFLREFFFPSGCALCGGTLIGPEEAWYGLCESCRGELGIIPGERCDSCGRPLISEKNRCLACRNGEERSFDRVILLFPYAGKYRRLLGAYKFNKNLALGHFFAEQIRKALGEFPEFPPGTALIPVPPRPGKIRKTGWDQVEYLVKLLEKGRGKKPPPEGTSLPRVCRCLKRLPSKSQKELNRENRLTNLRGRMILRGKSPEQALILDDVFTTGSTMETCAAALKKGGAEKVYGLCLFYTY
jgi:ComF family protein